MIDKDVIWRWASQLCGAPSDGQQVGQVADLIVKWRDARPSKDDAEHALRRAWDAYPHDGKWDSKDFLTYADEAYRHFTR